MTGAFGDLFNFKPPIKMPRNPGVQRMTRFMCRLIADLSKTRQESTVHFILRTLCLIRNDEPFDDLKWLEDVEGVLETLRAMSGTDSTLRTHVGRILTVLGDSEIAARYKTVFDECKQREKTARESHTKTAREELKLVSWERVLEVRDRLSVQTRDWTAPWTPKQLDALQQWLLILLFTEFPPRRNDYALMDVVRTTADTGDIGFNYYVLETRRFIFNNYKTREQFHQQEFEVPAVLCEAIERIVLPRMDALNRVPMLVNQNGSRINATSTMSRLMTKAFGTPMGPTAMRHIVLAHEFPTLLRDLERRKQWAERMAHSLSQQVDYIREDEEA